MNLQRTMALLKLELKKLIRDPTFLFSLILLPVILTLAFGLAMSGIPTASNPEVSIFEFMVPGIYGFTSVYIVMTVAMAFTDYRKEGLLDRINTTPTTSSEFMGSHVIANILISLLQVAIITVLALILGFRIRSAGFLLAFAFVGFLALSSVGFGLISATFAKSSGAAVGVSMIFFMPQMLFGTWIPMSEATQIVGMFFPIYYSTSSIQMILNGVPLTEITIWINLVVLAIYGVVIVIIGTVLFKRFGKT